MKSLGVLAHAKINPILRVGRLRQDGYHDVDTVLQAVGLHDIVTLRPAAQGHDVTCSDPSLAGEANLAWRAIRLASEIVDIPPCTVHIEKHIPQQAGLGGGSSDAAATLRLLNHLVAGALCPHLLDVGLACGSDVPFFLGESAAASATGRGEVLEPIKPPPPAPLLLAMPREAVCSTSAAYSRLDLMPERDRQRPNLVPQNDFELVAPVECLSLLDELRRQTPMAGLCGSGSAVYAFLDDPASTARALQDRGLWAISTKTIERFGDVWTQ